MIIPVHMFAFADEGDRSVVRQVEVPEFELVRVNNKVDYFSPSFIPTLLDLVFHFGQNDIQSKKMPSISVGDVVEAGNRYFMVMPAGWEELTKEGFEKLEPPTSDYCYGYGNKKELKGAQ